MSLSSLRMMMQDCCSWTPRQIRVCGILLENTSGRSPASSEFLCSQSCNIAAGFVLLGCYNYLYRMKALDAIRASEIPFHAEGRHPRSLMGKNFRSYLLDLRNTSTPFKGVRKALIDTLLDGYETARYGTGVFGQREYLRYQEALSELATVVKARSGNSQRQHQSAAKDLTQSPEVSPTTIQVTYLPSSQKSKRAKHFLELKSFKDNYNTLESTL
uniref:Uncharacterized protein n=1 Tax=Myotis myotis TaxID=51298 RepID=A0A7J7SRH0_MYOMY|nr:hypothetical protein mMyoMyo1_009365 [Myotis myotis]